MDGSDGTRKDTEDAQIEEVKCAIRVHLFVTKLSQQVGTVLVMDIGLP
jgi:hypothetical protein